MTELAILGGVPLRATEWPRYPVLGAEEEEAVLAVVRSHDLSSQMGTAVQRFEAEFAAYAGASHAVATSSGTTALHTALIAAVIGVGDDVIVPAYTFFSTATSVLMQNAIPIFADIETDTLGLDPTAVEQKITSRTRALMVVHMNGYPADLDGLMSVAQRHGLVVIEDCSHAHGAEHRGRHVGTIGHMGVFSFQQKKNLSLGEGGMLITNDVELADKARAIYSFGKVPLAYNYRMPELHGAIGSVRLKRLDAENEKRNRYARYLDGELARIPWIEPQGVRPDTRAVYYNYVLHYHEERIGLERDRFVAAIQAEGIPVPQLYDPVYRHHTFQVRDPYGQGFPFESPFYETTSGREPSYEDGTCPVAEEYCSRRNIELKIHPTADTEDIEQIAAAFHKVADQVEQLKAAPAAVS